MIETREEFKINLKLLTRRFRYQSEMISLVKNFYT